MFASTVGLLALVALAHQVPSISGHADSALQPRDDQYCKSHKGESGSYEMRYADHVKVETDTSVQYGEGHYTVTETCQGDDLPSTVFLFSIIDGDDWKKDDAKPSLQRKATITGLPHTDAKWWFSVDRVGDYSTSSTPAGVNMVWEVVHVDP